MTSELSLKRFPALQARMGDWDYYITTLTLEEVAKRVLPATKIVTSLGMNNWIQRRVMPGRAENIANYLIEREQHFFPSIVIGVYLGDPTWYPINVEDNEILGTPGLDPRSSETLGILELDGTEELYAIDGQHRVAGIRKALDLLSEQGRTEDYNLLANETLSVAFVSADRDEKTELERVRRLFTTLNKEAKKVSEPEIVALDEDDPAAIVTRWVATRYEGLKPYYVDEKESQPNLIQLSRQHAIRGTNRRSVTTIVTLYRTIKSIFRPKLQRLATEYKGNRPDEEKLEELYNEAVSVWELLREYDSALNDVLGTDPAQELAGKYRTPKGGHIFFRPVGLQAFSGALGVLKQREVDTESAIKSLCRLPTEISEPPWEHILWNPVTGKMSTVNRRPVAEALYLHMVGHQPRTKRYPLNAKYSELLGQPGGEELKQVPVYGLE